MIFVTLGTQKFQMNRLIKAADKLADQVDEEIFIQTGNSTYKPRKCKYEAFMSPESYKEKIEKCSCLITHAGVGTIITGVNADKPVIVVPRLAAMKEHVDDHQKEIAEAFSGKGCVLYCKNADDLKKYVDMSKTYNFQPYVVHGGKIEDIILDFISIFA